MDDISNMPVNQVYAPGNLMSSITQLRDELQSLWKNDYKDLIHSFEPIRPYLTQLHIDPDRLQTKPHNYLDWFYDYFGNRIFGGMMPLLNLQDQSIDASVKQVMRMHTNFADHKEWFRLLRMDFEFCDIRDEKVCSNLRDAMEKLDAFQKKVETLDQHMNEIILQYSRQSGSTVAQAAEATSSLA